MYKDLVNIILSKDYFNKGTVYIAGAGPGDLSLTSLKTLSLILYADVIIYDHLVNKKILNFVSNKTELIYAGKQSGKHTLNQSEINGLIIAKANENKIVLRLKGGDPFVFGRGGEEALFCKNNNIPFEIIPGITAATAVAAYAGVPVTHRNTAVSFCMITGHEDLNKNTSQLNYEALAKIDTLAIYMGVKNLNDIINQLIKHGKNPNTPAVAIQWGTYNFQKVIESTLENIYTKAVENNLTPPSIIITGEVVRLRKELKWFENRPLFNKRIVVTRDRNQMYQLTNKLELLGAEIIEFPTIEITSPDDFFSIDKVIDNFNSFDIIVFTSVNGVEYTLQRIFETGFDVRIFSNLKIVSIGKSTTKKLNEYGLIVDYQPKLFTSEEIFKLLNNNFTLSNLKIVLIQTDISPDYLKNSLETEGANVTTAIAYNTKKPEYTDTEISESLNGKIDMIIFTSSSTVKNFFDIVKNHKQIYNNKNIKIVSIGPVTTKTLNEYEIAPDIEANEYTIDGIIDSLNVI